MLKSYLAGLPFSGLIRMIGKFDIGQIVAAFQDDPFAQSCYYRIWRTVIDPQFTPSDEWITNQLLNLWEQANGETVLNSYPTNIIVPISEICNARCPFCSSWHSGSKIMKPEELEPFAGLIKYANYFGLVSHGEPLVNPYIDEILGFVKRIVDPRSNIYVVTNGKLLGDKLDLLFDTGLTGYTISLNAATSQTHSAIMKLGDDAFDATLAAIRRLHKMRTEQGKRLSISLSMVLIQENIQEAPAFIDLANDLGADVIYLRTLAPVTGDMDAVQAYRSLLPTNNPAFADTMKELYAKVSASRAKVEWAPDTIAPAENESCACPISLPKPMPKATGRRGAVIGDAQTNGSNPFDRQPPFHCAFPYELFNCNSFSFQLGPCCYMDEISGCDPVFFDSSFDFMELWNSPAFQRLRGSLKHGPMLDACKICPQSPQEGLE